MWNITYHYLSIIPSCVYTIQPSRESTEKSEKGKAREGQGGVEHNISLSAIIVQPSHSGLFSQPSRESKEKSKKGKEIESQGCGTYLTIIPSCVQLSPTFLKVYLISGNAPKAKRGESQGCGVEHNISLSAHSPFSYDVHLHLNYLRISAIGSV